MVQKLREKESRRLKIDLRTRGICQAAIKETKTARYGSDSDSKVYKGSFTSTL